MKILIILVDITKLLVNIIVESIVSVIERIQNSRRQPTFLAYNIVSFTKEDWVDGIIRQGRLRDYLFP